MSRMLSGAALPLLSLLSLVWQSAHATNGYLSHGYGIKSKGQAGVGIASPQDGLTIATNPAGLVHVADGFDFGLDLFSPRRDSTLRQGSVPVRYSGNDSRHFVIPEGAYSRRLNADVAVGLALFGNGGMNTDYGTNPFGRFGAQGPAGIDLAQAFVAPAVAFRVASTQSIGVAVNLAYQRFRAEGVGLFAGFSADPQQVSNRGYDHSTGWGVRVGWIGQFGSRVRLGATWQSKTRMGKFERYAGLFADEGVFDVPENYGVGAELRATDALTLALDWQKILYSGVSSVGNPVDRLFSGIPLGAAGGPGFGWQDVAVVKLGASQRLGEKWTVRGGVSHVDQPIPASQTFFNILAPGTVQTHLTVGATRRIGKASEASFSYMHAFRRTVGGSGSIPAAFGGGEVDLALQENALGFSYTRRF